MNRSKMKKLSLACAVFSAVVASPIVMAQSRPQYDYSTNFTSDPAADGWRPLGNSHEWQWIVENGQSIYWGETWYNGDRGYAPGIVRNAVTSLANITSMEISFKSSVYADEATPEGSYGAVESILYFYKNGSALLPNYAFGCVNGDDYTGNGECTISGGNANAHFSLPTHVDFTQPHNFKFVISSLPIDKTKSVVSAYIDNTKIGSKVLSLSLNTWAADELDFAYSGHKEAGVYTETGSYEFHSGGTYLDNISIRIK